MKKMEPTKLCCLLIITTSILVAVVYSVDEPLSLSLPGCNNKCGNITIPYPFGIANSSIPNQRQCFLEPKFNLTCENNTKLYWYELQVSHIDILKNQLEVLFYVSKYCNINKKYTDQSLSTTFRHQFRFLMYSFYFRFWVIIRHIMSQDFGFECYSRM